MSRRHSATSADAGVSYLDAGCSGSPAGAEAGSLAIMVGGDEGAYDRCRPIFEAVGKQIAYLGPSGNGHLAKVINNMITKMTEFVIAESLTVASKADLDLARLLDVITTGAARSWILSQAGELFHESEDERYSPTFAKRPPSEMGARQPADLGSQDGRRARRAGADDQPGNRAYEVCPRWEAGPTCSRPPHRSSTSTPESTSTLRPNSLGLVDAVARTRVV